MGQGPTLTTKGKYSRCGCSLISGRTSDSTHGHIGYLSHRHGIPQNISLKQQTYFTTKEMLHDPEVDGFRIAYYRS